MSSISLGSPGYVYLIGNGSMPGLLKLGATTDDPNLRAKQLTASTSSPTPFHVLYSREVPDVNAMEAAMHAAFASQRINENREFFRVSLYEAATTLDALCGDTQFHQDPPTPWANLFATFPDNGTARDLTEEERAACADLASRLADDAAQR